MDTSQKKNYKSIQYLRVVAMFMVAYTHLGPNMFSEWQIAKAVSKWITIPFAVIQNFGAFAVSIFFIISGFLLYKNKDGIFRFIKKKYIYIYIPLWIMMGSFFLIVKILEKVMQYYSYWSQFSIREWLCSASLYSYLIGKGDVLNGVLWYLFPLTMSFALYVLLIALKNTKLARFRHMIFVVEVNAIMIILTTVELDARIIGLKNMSPFLGIILMGYLVGMFLDNEVRMETFFKMILITILTLSYSFYNVYPDGYYSSEPYLVSALYGLMIFTICLLLDDKFKTTKIITLLSAISYPFYVYHNLIGGLIITYLWSQKELPFTIAFCVAISSVFVVAYLFHKFQTSLIKKLRKE